MIAGVVGGGQLARMLALAGHPLGIRLTVLDPGADICAADVAGHLHGAYDDRALLAQLADQTDVVTYEFENVPAESVAFLAATTQVFPGAAALAVARDRIQEKTLFQRLGIATAAYASVDSFADLQRAVAGIGLPAVLKTRTLGYDGKGQRVLREQADLQSAWEALGKVPLILEGFVAFDREISVIAVRGRDGDTRFWPVAENTHREGILRLSLSCPGDALQGLAEDYARRILESLDYVGVMALELFQKGTALLANEMAPRVHNSGHWTIEGAATSQFENHLRAVCGLPLGSTAPVGHAAMVNFIGTMPAAADVLALSGVHLHDYRKAARPGRKVGHATLRADSHATLRAGLPALLKFVE